jgi:pterin-4a-carbinolamine dehydratase
MSHHKVKTHRWSNGQLISNEFSFESFDEALAFTGSIDLSTSVKIYDEQDQVVHEAGTQNVDTYA